MQGGGEQRPRSPRRLWFRPHNTKPRVLPEPFLPLISPTRFPLSPGCCPPPASSRPISGFACSPRALWGDHLWRGGARSPPLPGSHTGDASSLSCPCIRLGRVLGPDSSHHSIRLFFCPGPLLPRVRRSPAGGAPGRVGTSLSLGLRPTRGRDPGTESAAATPSPCY